MTEISEIYKQDRDLAKRFTFLCEQNLEVNIKSLLHPVEKVKILNSNEGPERRGLSTAEEINKSERIITIEPQAISINIISSKDSSISCQNTCQHCFRDHDNSEEEIYVSYNDKSNIDNVMTLVTCTHCKIYKYCNQKCYNDSWEKIHQFECEIICRILELNEIKDNKSMITFLRLGTKLFLKSILDQDFGSRLLNLTTHIDSIKNSRFSSFVQDCTKILREAIAPNINIELEDYIFQLLCTVLVNFNTQMNVFKENIGVSFDPDFAMINHSCIPNTTIVPLSNSKFCMVASSRIRKNKEVFTNYIFTNIPKQLRQFELKERFFFDCACTLCQQKYDYYFSYNCANCGQIICDMNFNSFFSDDIIGLNFKSCSQIDVCCNCQKPVDLDKIKRVRELHQLLLANMLLEGEEHQVMGDEVTADELKENSKLNLNRLRGYSAQKILNDLLAVGHAHYEITNAKVEALREICTELIDSRIIPGYCYPLNIYISSLSTMHTKDVMFSESHYRACLLKYNAQRRFLTDIPSDLSLSWLSYNTYFWDTANDLLSLAESVMVDSKSAPILSQWIPDAQKLIAVLIKSSLFFYYQAIEILLQSISFSEDAINELVRSIYHIQYLITIQKKIQISKELSDWFKMGPENFTSEMFSEPLQQIFYFIKIPIIHKGGIFKLAFADRNRLPLFIPFEELKSIQVESVTTYH